MRRCARLTCCTAFGRMHRFWCLFVWLSTSGMRSVGGFRRFDVEQLKRPGPLRSRSDRSRRKPESALAHCRNPRDRESDCVERIDAGLRQVLAKTRYAQVRDRKRNSRCRKTIARTAPSYLAEIVRSAEQSWTTDSMGRKLRDGRSGLLRLHRGQRGTASRTRPAGRFSREPDFRSPRDYRSDHCRVAVALNCFCTAVATGLWLVPGRCCSHQANAHRAVATTFAGSLP